MVHRHEVVIVFDVCAQRCLLIKVLDDFLTQGFRNEGGIVFSFVCKVKKDSDKRKNSWSRYPYIELRSIIENEGSRVGEIDF